MAVYLAPIAGVAAQFFDNNGNPLSGGKLYTYQAGTTTAAITYTTSAGTTAHTNPIILDSAGRIPSGGEVWLSTVSSYKFILKNSSDVTIATWDNLDGINSSQINNQVKQEIQIANNNQTVFTLSNSYVVGANTLSVFVDGLNQYGPSATYSYVETNNTTVTFNNGLHTGAVVKFTTSIPINVFNGTAFAAPTTGTYASGDIIFNSAPTAGGFIGWVCVTSGTPGTWKTFGAISA